MSSQHPIQSWAAASSSLRMASEVCGWTEANTMVLREFSCSLMVPSIAGSFRLHEEVEAVASRPCAFAALA